jgi:16S rRNA (uracil1498-N3)-methyltransferase
MDNLFYTPDISGKTYQLEGPESKHCIKVLRHSKGDILQLIDGKGGWYQAVITDPNPKQCKVEIIKHWNELNSKTFYSHVAIAPTKNIERFEWFLEKATELGVDEVTPIYCDHSERKNVNHERLEKIMISAIKQSQKATLPRLNKMVNFETLISLDRNKERYIAHCAMGNKQHLLHCAKPQSRSLILIGPEGDFSEKEIQVALLHDFVSVSLGDSRLRTETAGLAACHIINLINENK